VVGSGGKSHYPILDPLPNSEVHNDESYGVLKLTLHPKSYEWRFVPVEGEAFTDSGSARCH
jgi:acid phosphatase type 7